VGLETASIGPLFGVEHHVGRLTREVGDPLASNRVDHAPVQPRVDAAPEAAVVAAQGRVDDDVAVWGWLRVDHDLERGRAQELMIALGQG